MLKHEVKMTKQLVLEDRIKMEALLDADISISNIAKQLGRHRSTIHRERNREGVLTKEYSATIYQNQVKQNMMRNQKEKAPLSETIKVVEDKILNEQWSPEQISHWLIREGKQSISHTWIYKHVKEDKSQGGELHNHLRRGGSYSKGPKEYKGKIKNRVSIEERPDAVNQRTRLGDYEIDLIVGPKNKGAILTAVDRKSRKCCLGKLDGKTADGVRNKVISLLPDNTLTVTSDNGTEFSHHEKIASEKNLKYYFAHPYASYERGSIENLNGLIRQYIPKGQVFDAIDDERLKEIENKLNNRPRKVLGFLSPIEYVEKYSDVSQLRV